MIRISRSHFSSPHEGEKSSSLSLMTHSQENNHTYSLEPIFLLNNGGQKLEAGDSVLMVLLASFDLTDSRGLSWSIHNDPDLSTVFCCGNCDTNHQHPFMAILNWVLSPTRIVFSTPQTKVQMALTLTFFTVKHSPFVPHCLIFQWFLHSHSPQKWHPCLPARLRSDVKGRCSEALMTVAVKPKVWPHRLHTGLYRLK